MNLNSKRIFFITSKSANGFASKTSILNKILFSIFIFIFSISISFALGVSDSHFSNKKEIDFFSSKKNENQKLSKPENLICFEKAYPDIIFNSKWDEIKNDYLITVKVPQKDGSIKQEDFYWCGSRFLPKEKFNEKDNYSPLLYFLPDEVPDPSTFSEEQIHNIKQMTSKEKRKSSPIDPPFLFDLIYDLGNQAKTESHIKKIYLFKDWSVNVHEKLKEPIKKIAQKVENLPKNEEINNFFRTLNRTDGFNWRNVRDKESRSYHSIGLAIDILPRGYYQKIIYWSWQKQLNPENWWNTPIKNRWAPPKCIIDIFCEEGFIWGGYWLVWDNMHFEYHPELIEYNKKIRNK